MSLGKAKRQFDILDENRRFCEKLVGEKSAYALLHRERDQLFPDEMFADLYATRGRHSIPPSVVAVVMVLQKLEGLSSLGGTGSGPSRSRAGCRTCSVKRRSLSPPRNRIGYGSKPIPQRRVMSPP